MMWRLRSKKNIVRSNLSSKNSQNSRARFSSTDKEMIAIWGFGDRGQLGLGDEIHLQLVPKVIDKLIGTNVRHIGNGFNHTLLCVEKEGKTKIIGFGVNEEEQLATKGKDILSTPTEITHPLWDNAEILAISGGAAHTFMQIKDNQGQRRLIGFGRNLFGQLGTGSYQNHTSPTEIEFFRGIPISSISCGEDFSIISTKDSKTYFLGRNDAGQLGKEEAQSPHPKLMQELNGVVVTQLASGWGHTVALTNDGLFTWGSNLHSQCGHNVKSKLSPVKHLKIGIDVFQKVDCGGCHSMVLDLHGNVHIFGSGGDGKMMSPTNSDLLRPTLIDWFQQQKCVIKDIASGIDHLSAVDEQGVIWSWGFGQHGTFGAGKSSLKTSIVPIPLTNPFPGYTLQKVACGMDIVVGVWK